MMDKETLDYSMLSSLPDDNLGVLNSIEIRPTTNFLPTEEFGDVAKCMRTIFGIPSEFHVGWLDCLTIEKEFSESEYLVVRNMHLLGKIGLELGYVNLCTMYKYKDKDLYIQKYSEDLIDRPEELEPMYINLQGGWKMPNYVIRDYFQLPTLARNYIRLIETFVNKPVRLIEVGPNREDVVFKE